MSGDELIVAIVFGTILVGFIFGRITGLVKEWIKSRGGTGYDNADFERMAKAFMKHKKQMEKRVRNLEAIIADDNPEVDLPELEEPDEAGTLRNDLQSKKEQRRS